MRVSPSPYSSMMVATRSSTVACRNGSADCSIAAVSCSMRSNSASPSVGCSRGTSIAISAGLS